MSAAATAAGYLYASGKLRGLKKKETREQRIETLIEHYIGKGMTTERAREFAEEAIARLDARKTARR